MGAVYVTCPEGADIKDNVCATPRARRRRRFGVRQLAAAFSAASLLAVVLSRGRPGQQAGLQESGSKLPHSKAAASRSP
jgi:hypothetical protein